MHGHYPLSKGFLLSNVEQEVQSVELGPLHVKHEK